MDSDGYYTSYYPAFTPKEKKHLRQFLGPDYFKRNLQDEQIHRILSRLRPSFRQRLKTNEILPFLSKKSVLTDTEIHHLKSSDAQPMEQTIRLVEFFMNKGTYGIATLYLCLLESSEQVDGVPGHYHLAGELKEVVQAECGISLPSGLTAVSSTHQQQQSLQTRVKKLFQIPLDPETAKTFTANLGLSASDFRTPPTSFQAICQRWLSQGSAPGDLDQLVEALVSTRGLGRHTSYLCSPALAASLEVRNFLLSLRERWVELAGFLGFSEEEVGAITEAHASNTEQQVVEFLKLWQLPECGQRTLPLMHKLKALAGIVEPRNPSRRLANKPGRSAYMNRRLRTDSMGKPHRSLDTCDRPFHSLGGAGTGGGSPSTAAGSSYQRTQSLGSPGYHQHSQGSGSNQYGYQTEGRGTSHGYQTEGHGLSNGYQDERRVSTQGKGQESYQGSQDYHSTGGYQSDGQQKPRLLLVIFPKHSSGYEGDYEGSYESGYEYDHESGYGRGHGSGYGSRDLRHQDPVIEELPDDQPPDVDPNPAPSPTSPPDELCPPLEERVDSAMELDPNLPPPPDSYIDQQGYTVITNGLALPTDSVTFNGPDQPRNQRRDELTGVLVTETATTNFASESTIREHDARTKPTALSDTMDVGDPDEPKRKKSNELLEENAAPSFSSRPSPPGADQPIRKKSNDPLGESGPSFTSGPNPGANQPMSNELLGESGPSFTSGPNPGANQPMSNELLGESGPSFTSGPNPGANQPMSNELLGESAAPSLVSRPNPGADQLISNEETASPGFTSGPSPSSADRPISNELLEETAAPGYTRTPSPPGADQPIRKKSNELLGETAGPGFTRTPSPPSADQPIRKKSNELVEETATPGFTRTPSPPGADQPIRKKSNELVEETAAPSTTRTPSPPSADQPIRKKSNELLKETATPSFTRTPSPPGADQPIRKKSNELLGEDDTASSVPSELNVQESDTHTDRTEASDYDVSVTRKQPTPLGATLMGNEVLPTENRRSDDDADLSDSPTRKSLHLPLHAMEDEPENDLSAVTPDSPDESPIVSFPVQASATDGEPPVMVGLQPSQAIDSQGVIMQPTLVAGSSMFGAGQSISSQTIGVGTYKSLQSTNSELVLQPLHSVGNSPVVANAQLLSSVAAMSPSAATTLPGSQPSDDQPVDPPADSMHPSSLHSLSESELEQPNRFSLSPVHSLVHSPGSPLHVEHTSEVHMPAEASLLSVSTVSQPQPLLSTGSGEPFDSVQPQQQQGASGVFSATATSTSASPGSSRSATPVGVLNGQGSTSEIPSASPSESGATPPHSSHSASSEHMLDLEEDEDLVTGPPRQLSDVMERDSVAREPCSEDVVRALEDPEGLEMLTALVNSGARINSPTANGTYPIHLAVNSGSTDKVLFLLNNNCNVRAARPDGKTGLHLACLRQDFQMVQVLVEKGADSASEDEQGFTCLHFKETLESMDIVRYLLHKGAPVDKPSKESYLTPLLVCCFAGDATFEAACLLITKGASVNGSLMAAMKPLIVSSAEGHLRMVGLLLDNGVDVTVCDQDGCTALLKACENNHLNVARQLCERRTDANRQGIDVNKPNKDGLTPLMAAVSSSNQELVVILISHGANANCSRQTTLDLAGSGSYPVEMTPLADAAAKGHLDIVQVLVDGRAEVNGISQTGFPPIAFAVLENRTNIVEYFLKLNDLNTTLAGLSQPFVVAMKTKNRQCAELLAGRYGGIERLLEDAVQEGRHELVEHIRLYQQMDGHGSQSTVETPVQPVQPAPQVELIPRPPDPSPPPSTPDEPLNDFSQEPLNQLDDDVESDSSSSIPNPNPGKPVTPPQQTASPVPVPGASVSVPTHTQQNDFNQPPPSPRPPLRTSPQPTLPFNPHTQPNFTQAPTSTSPPLVRTPSSSKSISPIPEALPPQATSSQTWQPGPLPLSTAQVTSSQPWRPGTPPFSTTQATSSQPWQPGPLPLTTAQVTSSQPWRPGTPPFSTTQATSSKPWQPGPLPLATTQAISSQPGPLPSLATSSINNFDPPVRAVLPRHPHPHSGGGATVSLQQAGEVARAQAGEESVAVGEDHDPHSLFAARPKSPPPVAPEQPVSHTVLPTPDSLNHSVVEVLHEFAQICISAAVRDRGHEWLIDKAVVSGYSHIFGFFMQYFDSSAAFARDGKLVAEFIGGSPSPLNFLLGEHLVTKSDFEAVLEEIGRPDFMEQLMMALHQFPDSEGLPWTASELMDSLFNQHFAIGSPFPNPSSTQPPSLTPHNPTPSPPPPQTPAHTFPSSGGHKLGWGSEEEKRNSQSKLMGLAQTATSKSETASNPDHSAQLPTPPPTTMRSERTTGGSTATMSRVHTLADARGTGSGFGGATSMESGVVKTKGATSVTTSFVSPLPSLVQATEEDDDSDDYELNDLSVLDDPEPSSFEPQLQPQWQSTGASVAATGGIGNPLPSEPQSQLQPQMHSKAQSGASLSLETQQQGHRLGYGTTSSSSIPPFHQQNGSTTTPAGATPPPKTSEVTSAATEASTTVAKPPAASMSGQSTSTSALTATKQPQSFSLPPQSKSQSSLLPPTGTSVSNTMPTTSTTQPPEFQQNSFSSSSHVSDSPSSTQLPFSSSRPPHSTVTVTVPQEKGGGGATGTQQPPTSSFQKQSKSQSSTSEQKPLTSSTATNVLVTPSTSTQAPKFRQQSLASSSPVTVGAVSSTSLSTFSHTLVTSVASTSSSSHSSETAAPNPGSKGPAAHRSYGELHHMISATRTEAMKPKTGVPTPKRTISKSSNATTSAPQRTSKLVDKPQPMSPKPSRIPVRIQSAQSSRSSSTENISSKKLSGSTPSVNRARKAPTTHSDTATGKRPSPLPKELNKQKKVVLKQPASTFKQAPPSTSKIQPPISTHHRSFASTSSLPSKSSPVAASASPASRANGGAAFSTSTDEETDLEEQVQLDRDHRLTRNESGYSTMSAGASSASKTVRRQASSLAVDEVVFPAVPITDCESQLFKVLSRRVPKWKIFGRYLGLEDDLLERIGAENQFCIEKCYKMLEAWKRQFRSDATYQKLEEGLRNIMREDLLFDIGQFVPRDHGSEAEEPLSHTIDVRSKENPNLRTVREEFQQQKNNGMRRAYVTLEYRSDAPLHKEPLCFIAPSLDDLGVLEDLCKFAGSCEQREICISLRYLAY